MSNIYKGEFQDYEGNVVYPHTSADVVFATDGQTIQKKLNDAEIDYTDVKAQLTSGEHEFRFGVTADGEFGYHKEVEGADTVVPFNLNSNALIGYLIFIPGVADAVNSLNLSNVFPDIFGKLGTSDFSDFSVDCRQSWANNGRNNIVLSYDKSTGILTGKYTITTYASGVLVYPIYFIRNKTFHKISACSDSESSAVVDCSILPNYKSLSEKNFVPSYVYWDSNYDAYQVKRGFGQFIYNKQNGQLTIIKAIQNAYQNSVGNFEIGVIY